MSVNRVVFNSANIDPEIKKVFGNVSDYIDTLSAGAGVPNTAADTVTAHAGGGQASAQSVTAGINRVSVVATAGDSVKLPVSAAGLLVILINDAALPMQVFGNGTDTINDVATATGVSQMPQSLVVYTATAAGNWMALGIGVGYNGSYQTMSWADTLTAHAGGGQASATPLTGMINRVSVVATAGDSVVLPAAIRGTEIQVYNDAALAMNVFPAGTDTINDLAASTQVSQIPQSIYTFLCTTTGLWQCESVGTGFVGNLPTVSSTNGITAFATGGQASAVLLTTVINRVTTVGTAADSVKMPAAVAGLQMTVTNAAAANSMNLFPNTGDQINAGGANAAYAIAAGKTAQLTCAVAGQWHAVLSA